MKKLPPYAKQMRIPANNETAYVFIDWVSREKSAPVTQARGMVFEPTVHPSEYKWPVRRCGVIIMDWYGLGEQNMIINALKAELLAAGAIDALYIDFTRSE